MPSNCLSIINSVPLLLVLAIMDLIVHIGVALLLHSNSTLVFEKFAFWLIFSAPSIFVIYAILKDHFGALFLWPFAYSVFCAIAGHVLLCFVLAHLDEKKKYSSTSFMLLFFAIFYTIYALAIVKHWKDHEDAKAQPNNLIAAEGNA